MFIPLHDSNPLRVIPFQAVTVGIIAGCVGVFLWQQTLPAERVDDILLAYGAVPAAVLHNAPAPVEHARIPSELTLLSSMFLHGGWMHLIGNMLFLWVFGDNIEDAMGHTRFVVFYLVCGLVGSLVYVLSLPQSTTPLIGASGAVAGVLGAYLVLHPRVKVLVLAFNRIPIRLPAYVLLGAWIAFQILALLTGSDPTVAWWAHIGGFVAGMVLVVPLRRRDVPLFDQGVAH